MGETREAVGWFLLALALAPFAAGLLVTWFPAVERQSPMFQTYEEYLAAVLAFGTPDRTNLDRWLRDAEAAAWVREHGYGMPPEVWTEFRARAARELLAS